MAKFRVPMLNSKGYLELLDVNPVHGPVYIIIFHFGDDDASWRYLDPKRLLYLLDRSILFEKAVDMNDFAVGPIVKQTQEGPYRPGLRPFKSGLLTVLLQLRNVDAYHAFRALVSYEQLIEAVKKLLDNT